MILRTEIEDVDTSDTDNEEGDEGLNGNRAETLIVLKETTLTIEKKWLRNDIFCSTGTMNGQATIVVIEKGSSDNIIFQALVDRLKLKVCKHYRPYFAR